LKRTANIILNFWRYQEEEKKKKRTKKTGLTKLANFVIEIPSWWQQRRIDLEVSKEACCSCVQHYSPLDRSNLFHVWQGIQEEKNILDLNYSIDYQPEATSFLLCKYLSGNGLINQWLHRFRRPSNTSAGETNASNATNLIYKI